MTIRNFVLRDLPTLHRYRQNGQFLDTATDLTWGPTVVPVGALLTHLAPATGIFTYLSHPDDTRARVILAQLIHHQNSSCARFSFIAPENALESPAFQALVEYMAQQIVERGAHNLVAEVDEGTLAYASMRRIGFAVYARQRVWQMDPEDKEIAAPAGWASSANEDGISIRSLYNAIVPGLTQQVEAPPWERQKGITFRQEGELLAYVDLNYGPRAILAQPFFHPDVQNLVKSLRGMLASIPNRRSRPVYVKVRSYQGWLEGSLEEINAVPGPRQAVVVKRLALPVHQHVQAALPALNGTTANPTLPIARFYTSRAARKVRRVAYSKPRIEFERYHDKKTDY
jgi:hypothetical protein